MLIGFALFLVFGFFKAIISSGVIPPVTKKVAGITVQQLIRYGFYLALLIILLGFGLAFFQSSKESKVSADIDSIVKTLTDSHQIDLEQRDEVITTLRETVSALAKIDGPGIEEALDQLAEGNTAAAEAIFADILEQNSRLGKTFNQEAAEAARHLGSLAFLHDTQKAIEAYQRAVELEPENAEGWNQLGHLQRRVGELDQAITSFLKVLELGETQDKRDWKAAAYGNLGSIYSTHGDLDEAEAMHQRSLAIHEELGRKEGMANQYGNLGVIYSTRGDLDEAEAMLKHSLAINEELGRKQGMAIQYANLGLIYKENDNFQGARRVWELSIKLFSEVGARPNVELVQSWLDDIQS
ncbi:MAG: hypothetical protein Tsb002_02800 [Wenzhouxiangellaceae bacterium]